MTATMLDLEPPASEVKRLLAGITDEQLSAPTPCESTPVAGLLDHFIGLTGAFRDAARKATGPNSPPASVSAANLDPEWRTVLPKQLDELAAAWKDPAAWEGMTWAGGVELPAEVMGGVAVDELVLHGWDLARATGQSFSADQQSTEACFGFTSAMSQPGEEAGREGLFGPVVEVDEDAPMLDRALGFSGRDPSWTLDRPGRGVPG